MFLEDISWVFPGYGEEGLQLRKIEVPTAESEGISDMMPKTFNKKLLNALSDDDDEVPFVDDEDGDPNWEESGFYSWARRGRLSLSSLLQWVDKRVTSLLGGFNTGISLSFQTDHLIGTSTNAPQYPKTARGGRVRSTTPAEDRYIVLSAKRNRRTTAQQVANQFLAASGKQISRKTVARRLKGGGLYARRPVVCVPLTRQHRTARLQWCREHHNWTEQDWACVLFSDESRFSLSSDCRRQLIWRESGTAYRPENIQEKNRYPTCSIMVWAGIMINGRTRLHVVANGTMTGQRYIDEVLLPHVRLFPWCCR
ncbi:transposable element Tcb2 transposase [Trichonephila clavipes]|uniref:Transposable element Tcb2 transposase n=1 Tax=Trichonephila clavipes TaxID=2585209 RepID=A0A8X6VCA2_TRICX|nr:transposable element Tcb2 transposase [Trichonephila clavipes]